jgi:hypothetical protein
LITEQSHPPEREQKLYARGAGRQDRRKVHQGVDQPLPGNFTRTTIVSVEPMIARIYSTFLSKRVREQSYY